MSTRSRIGMFIRDAEGNKSIRSVYCHFDGYPMGVGQTLLDHWTSPVKLASLIDLGDLSVLGEEIGEQHDFDWRSSFPNRDDFKGPDGETDWMAYYAAQNADPRAKMTLAYGRDRGETGIDPVVSEGIDAFLALASASCGEWAYLFDADNGGWSVKSLYGDTGWSTIEAAVEVEKAQRAAYEAERNAARSLQAA